MKTQDSLKETQKSLEILREKRDQLLVEIGVIKNQRFQLPVEESTKQMRQDLKNKSKEMGEQAQEYNSMIEEAKRYIKVIEQGREIEENQPAINTESSIINVYENRNNNFIVPQNLPSFRTAKFDDIKDLNIFFENLERIMNAYGLNCNNNWARILPLCVGPQIVEWINAFIPITAEWTTVKEKINITFGDPMATIKYQKQLTNIKMQKDESVLGFCTRFHMLAHKAKIDDQNELVITQLIAALPKQLQWQYYSTMAANLINHKSLSAVVQYFSVMPPAMEAAENMNEEIENREIKFCTYHQTNSHSDSECLRRKNKTVKFELKFGPKREQTEDTTKKPVSNFRTWQNKRFENNNQMNMEQVKPESNSNAEKSHFDDRNNSKFSSPSTNKVNNNYEHSKNSNNQEKQKQYKNVDNEYSMHDEQIVPQVEYTKVNDNTSGMFVVPIMVNNNKEKAAIDTQASHTFISKQLVKKLEIKYESVEKNIKSADPEIEIQGYGITEPILLQCGKLNIEHKCYIINRDPVAPQIILGQDLIPKLLGI